MEPARHGDRGARESVESIKIKGSDQRRVLLAYGGHITGLEQQHGGCIGGFAEELTCQEAPRAQRSNVIPSRRSLWSIFLVRQRICGGWTWHVLPNKYQTFRNNGLCMFAKILSPTMACFLITCIAFAMATHSTIKNAKLDELGCVARVTHTHKNEIVVHVNEWRRDIEIRLKVHCEYFWFVYLVQGWIL